MRIHLLAPLLFPLFLGGCDEKSHDMPAPPPDTRRIVDVTVMRSSPEGLHTFDGKMEDYLIHWTEVEQAAFYYEDPAVAITGTMAMIPGHSWFS